MSGLWIGIGLLTLLALAFLFWPFVRASKQQVQSSAEDRKQQNIAIFHDRLAELERERESGNLDNEAFEQLKLELEKSLLEDVVEQPSAKLTVVGTRQLVTVALLALITATAAMGLYSKFGRYEDLQIAQQRAEMRQDGRTPTIEEAIASLKAELAARPDNPEGWYMLASTYMNTGQYQEGAEALKMVLEKLPQEAPQYAGVMGQYAQALYFAQGNRVTPELRAHIDKTLRLEPQEVTTLGLLGIDAFEQQKYQQAMDYWVAALRNADGNAAESLRAGIEKAREALAAQGVEVAPIEELMPARIRVLVSLREDLKHKVTSDQVVFVFARPIGGRMPLAAQRLTVADLPAEVLLDDSMAMMPQAKLSSVKEVEINAKVSLSGKPEATPGDLFGRVAPVSVRAHDETLTLVIDQIVK